MSVSVDWTEEERLSFHTTILMRGYYSDIAPIHREKRRAMEKRKIDMSEKGWSSLTAEILYLNSRDCLRNQGPEKEVAFLKRRIAANGGRALDVACGTGRHLFQLLKDGLDVEGLDTSEDALKWAEVTAKEGNVSTMFYCQRMEQMDIPGRFNTLYICNGSFMVLSDRQQAMDALERFREHLYPGGELIIDLFVPAEAEDPSLIGKNQGKKLWPDITSVSGDGTISTRLWTKSVDLDEQTLISERLCELTVNGEIVKSELHRHPMRWYHPDEFTEMLEGADFKGIALCGDYIDRPPTKGSQIINYSAKTRFDQQNRRRSVSHQSLYTDE